MPAGADDALGYILSHTLIPAVVVIGIELILRRPGDIEGFKTLLVVAFPFVSMALVYYFGYFDKYLAEANPNHYTEL
jgi:hypothetical protein